MVNTTEDFEWETFLNLWNRDLWERLEDKKIENLPQEVINSKWLGYPPATENDISALEVKLGTTLPPSYKNFLKISNGWRRVSPHIDRIYQTKQVDWLARKNPDVIQGWLEGCQMEGEDEIPVSDEEYFVYGDRQVTHSLRNEYLQNTLKIGGESENGAATNGILLLNPEIIFQNGEWEVWFFAPWFPGAVRYQSFIESIQDIQKSILEEPKIRELL